MIRRLVALASLLGLILPAAAVADPPWSAAQDLSTAHLFVDPVHVTASGDGTALAWWSWQDGTGRERAHRRERGLAPGRRRLRARARRAAGIRRSGATRRRGPSP
jgi:hypothetical protein